MRVLILIVIGLTFLYSGELGIDSLNGIGPHKAYADGAFSWFLLVTYADGSVERFSYFTRDSCEEQLMLLSIRPNVQSVSECSGLNPPRPAAARRASSG